MEDNCIPCPAGFYSPSSSNICLECEPGTYTNKEGMEKCLKCDKIIPHCDSCSKDVNCLKCNNFAISGFSNCSVCENEIDWEFSDEYCNFKTKYCPKYFYKDKIDDNKNKIV